MRKTLACAVCLTLLQAACKDANKIDGPSEPAVSGVTVTPGSLSLQVGDSVALVAIVTGTTTDRSVSWSSTAPGVASVDAAGKVRALSAGVAIIGAAAKADPTKQGTASVIVSDYYTPTVTPSPVSVELGATQALSVTVRNSAGVPAPAAQVTFTSSRPTVASVSTSGVVTGLIVDTATITTTVSGEGGRSTTTKVTVTSPHLTVQVSPATASLVPGVTTSLLCTILNANTGQLMLGAVGTWSSANPAIATVNSSGVVTAVAAGITSVTCTALTGASASAQITVAVPALAITASPASLSLQVGQTSEALQVTVKDASGNPVTGRTITYTAANTAIATVASDGRVTGVAEGTTSLTVTVSGSGGGSISVPVTVTTPTLRVEFLYIGETLEPGQWSRPACYVKNVNNNATVTGVPLSWSSSNPAVATVDSTGMITAVSDGEATITCAIRGGTAAATLAVTVRTPPLVITVTPSPVQLTVGEKDTVSVTVIRADGTPVNGRTITFASNNTAVATVDANGVVTAVAQGGTTLFVTVSGPGGGTVNVAIAVYAPACGTSGTYTAKTSVKADTANHKDFINLAASFSVTVTVSGGAFSMSGGFPFVNVTGTINTSTCEVVATGTGTVAGYVNTQVRLIGYLMATGFLNGVYIMGYNRMLPGNMPIYYNLWWP